MDLAAFNNLNVISLLSAKSRYRVLANLGEISDSDFRIRILEHSGVKATPKDFAFEPREGYL